MEAHLALVEPGISDITPLEETIVRVPTNKVPRNIGDLIFKRNLTVVHYKDEEQMDVLFGFFMFPKKFDFDERVAIFRDAHPKVMSLSRWLVRWRLFEAPARKVRYMDEQYRKAAQKGGEIKRVENWGGEEVIKVIKPGEKPIRIDLSAIDANPVELKW